MHDISVNDDTWHTSCPDESFRCIYRYNMICCSMHVCQDGHCLFIQPYIMIHRWMMNFLEVSIDVIWLICQCMIYWLHGWPFLYIGPYIMTYRWMMHILDVSTDIIWFFRQYLIYPTWWALTYDITAEPFLLKCIKGQWNMFDFHRNYIS